MVRYIFIFLSLILCCCSSKDSLLSERERIGYQVISDFGKKRLPKGLKLCAIGGGERKGKTWKLTADFKADFELTLPIARKLIVEITEELLQKINSNEKLRSYLSNYPFTDKNLNLTIFGKNEQTKAPFLMYVGLLSSEVYYERKNPDGGLPITILKEPYEEAVRKIASAKEQDTHHVQ